MGKIPLLTSNELWGVKEYLTEPEPETETIKIEIRLIGDQTKEKDWLNR